MPVFTRELQWVSPPSTGIHETAYLELVGSGTTYRVCLTQAHNEDRNRKLQWLWAVVRRIRIPPNPI
ncbi:unnamed protein product [Cylicocyclus nassatus]|uniref:Uncharacterized protein n=1 Tax=Cylicocyclus nassatus TaxID=53992 RepID=A0AA36M828_CYLNA|nr:unnamed protein product [Cylicocyclus nassatus]